jgi:hypothetical protein
MLIAARYLVDRMRQPRSRADEVLTLRRRIGAEPSPEAVSVEEAAAARELAGLRQEMSQAIGAVVSCTTCAVGHPPPHGRFSGGHCCGLRTEDAFNDDEVAALRQAGTRPAALRLPRGDHAGCAFRGPLGCSLAVPNRPNLCLRYICPQLSRELGARGDLERIEAIGARLEEVYMRFIMLRRERLDAEEVAQFVAAEAEARAQSKATG